MYSINFTVTKTKLCLILHYNGANSYLFQNGTEICKFKAKDSEIVDGFNGYVYDFSGDYDATDVNDVKDIYKYLTKKNDVA